jgi:hypothetical protein
MMSGVLPCAQTSVARTLQAFSGDSNRHFDLSIKMGRHYLSERQRLGYKFPCPNKGHNQRERNLRMKKIKASVLAFVAVLAMGAVMASAAQAGNLTSASYPVILTGNQVTTNQFSIGGGVRVVSCTTATFGGTITGSTASVTLEPAYSGCTAQPSSLPSTVTMNGCDYTVSNPSGSALTAGVMCPTGKSISIVIKETSGTVLCEYSVGETGNTALTGSTFKNEGSGATEDVTATLGATPVTVGVVKGSKILCGAAAGSNTTGTLSGTATLKGFADSGGVEGAQQGIMIG